PAATGAAAATTSTPAFAAVQAIVTQRCAGCHAEHPSYAGFAAPPKGVMLETPEHLLAQLATVRQQVASRTMPLGNLTQMTDAERQTVIEWIDRGAPR
ncbi:MAG: c-type cytochrome, partial [Solimonas sp.]